MHEFEYDALLLWAWLHAHDPRANAGLAEIEWLETLVAAVRPAAHHFAPSVNAFPEAFLGVPDVACRWAAR